MNISVNEITSEEANIRAQNRLKEVKNLLEEEDENVDLDELEGKLDTEPQNPDLIGPPRARIVSESAQPRVMFDYRKFKKDKQEHSIT